MRILTVPPSSASAPRIREALMSVWSKPKEDRRLVYGIKKVCFVWDNGINKPLWDPLFI